MGRLKPNPSICQLPPADTLLGLFTITPHMTTTTLPQPSHLLPQLPPQLKPLLMPPKSVLLYTTLTGTSAIITDIMVFITVFTTAFTTDMELMEATHMVPMEPVTQVIPTLVSVV